MSHHEADQLNKSFLRNHDLDPTGRPKETKEAEMPFIPNATMSLTQDPSSTAFLTQPSPENE